MPTRVNENLIPVGDAGPSNQAQQSGIVPLATEPEPQRKGRRKLNRAIFDIDTAAALRTKVQPGHQMAEAKNPPVSDVTDQGEGTSTVHPPARSPEESSRSYPTERFPNVGSSAEQPQTPSKEVSYWAFRSFRSQLTGTGTYQNDPLLEVTVVSSGGAPIEDFLLPEVSVSTFVTYNTSDLHHRR
jgi:hypothetical protein